MTLTLAIISEGWMRHQFFRYKQKSVSIWLVSHRPSARKISLKWTENLDKPNLNSRHCSQQLSTPRLADFEEATCLAKQWENGVWKKKKKTFPASWAKYQFFRLLLRFGQCWQAAIWQVHIHFMSCKYNNVTSYIWLLVVMLLYLLGILCHAQLSALGVADTEFVE